MQKMHIASSDKPIILNLGRRRRRMSRRGFTESVIVAPESVADRQTTAKQFRNIAISQQNLSKILVNCAIR